MDNKGASLELDADSGLGIQAELIAREARQDLRFADGGVADQHHLEDVVCFLASAAVSTRHLTLVCKAKSMALSIYC